MADKTNMNQSDEGFTAPHEDAAVIAASAGDAVGGSHIKKNPFGGGFTTEYEDGTTSETQESIIGDGYITRHSDGSISRSRRKKSFSGDEVIETVHEDGSRSVTTRDKYGNLRTVHGNGSQTVTTRDSFGTGYTTRDTGVNSPTPGYDGNADSGGAGGLALLPLIAIIAIWILLVFIKVKWAFVILPLLTATIILRIKLNRKYNTGFFYLWLHPATLLFWRLLCLNFNIYMDNTDDGASSLFVVGGMILIIVGIVVGINVCKGVDWADNFLYILYSILSYAGSILAALANAPFYYTIPMMFGLALIATPIWIHKRRSIHDSDSNGIHTGDIKSRKKISSLGNTSIILTILGFFTFGITTIPGFICAVIAMIQDRKKTTSIVALLLSVAEIALMVYALHIDGYITFP